MSNQIKNLRVFSPNAPKFELRGQAAAITYYRKTPMTKAAIIRSADRLHAYFSGKEFKGTLYGGAFAGGFRRMAYIIAEVRDE